MVILHAATPPSLLEFGPETSGVYPIDPAAYVNGRCPANVLSNRYPPLCESDIGEMARLGFNAIRLPISWSVLEPERERFSKLLLDRIAQIVAWARADHLYVIVDMHQNAYSHYVGAGDSSVNLAYNSGAPDWATITDGLPSHVYDHQRELNPAVLEATTNFWYDRAGIQDEYLAALAFIAQRFKDDPVVAGYGLYNEPLPGWNLPSGFEDLLLFPFYRRAIDAITGARDGLPCWSGFFLPAVCGFRDLGVDDTRHLIFFEDGLLREVTDFPTHLPTPVSSYPNVVLSLHAYTHFYTVDKLLPQLVSSQDYPWGGYKQSYAFGEYEARALNAALFISEFGNAPADDAWLLAAQVVEQDRHRVGFAFWAWKENGAGGWGVYAPASSADTNADCLRADREQLLARVYPRATADPTATWSYDSASGRFRFAGRGFSGDAQTLIYVAPEVTGAAGVSGGAEESVATYADGSRTISIAPTGGPFTVDVAAAPLRLVGC